MQSKVTVIVAGLVLAVMWCWTVNSVGSAVEYVAAHNIPIDHYQCIDWRTNHAFLSKHPEPADQRWSISCGPQDAKGHNLRVNHALFGLLSYYEITTGDNWD